MILKMIFNITRFNLAQKIKNDFSKLTHFLGHKCQTLY
jgi:hypothetical protein